MIMKKRKTQSVIGLWHADILSVKLPQQIPRKKIELFKEK